MLVPYTKTGKFVQGTYETVTGVAGVFVVEGGDPANHADWQYTGETKIFWDGQQTVEENGQVVFIDEDGDEVLESEIVWKEEED